MSSTNRSELRTVIWKLIPEGSSNAEIAQRIGRDPSAVTRALTGEAGRGVLVSFAIGYGGDEHEALGHLERLLVAKFGVGSRNSAVRADERDLVNRAFAAPVEEIPAGLSWAESTWRAFAARALREQGPGPYRLDALLAGSESRSDSSALRRVVREHRTIEGNSLSSVCTCAALLTLARLHGRPGADASAIDRAAAAAAREWLEAIIVAEDAHLLSERVIVRVCAHYASVVDIALRRTIEAMADGLHEEFAPSLVQSAAWASVAADWLNRSLHRALRYRVAQADDGPTSSLGTTATTLGGREAQWVTCQLVARLINELWDTESNDTFVDYYEMTVRGTLKLEATSRDDSPIEQFRYPIVERGALAGGSAMMLGVPLRIPVVTPSTVSSYGVIPRVTEAVACPVPVLRAPLGAAVPQAGMYFAGFTPKARLTPNTSRLDVLISLFDAIHAQVSAGDRTRDDDAAFRRARNARTDGDLREFVRKRVSSAHAAAALPLEEDDRREVFVVVSARGTPASEQDAYVSAALRELALWRARAWLQWRQLIPGTASDYVEEVPAVLFDVGSPLSAAFAVPLGVLRTNDWRRITDASPRNRNWEVIGAIPPRAQAAYAAGTISEWAVPFSLPSIRAAGQDDQTISIPTQLKLVALRACELNELLQLNAVGNYAAAAQRAKTLHAELEMTLPLVANELGRLATLSRAFETAIKVARERVQADPSDRNAWTTLVVALSASGRRNEIARLAEGPRGATVDNPLLTFARVMSHAWRSVELPVTGSDLDDALTALTCLFREDAHSAEGEVIRYVRSVLGADPRKRSGYVEGLAELSLRLDGETLGWRAAGSIQRALLALEGFARYDGGRFDGLGPQ